MSMPKRKARGGRGSEGYALLALIVGLMIMAIWMTAAAPDVRTEAQREAETDFYYAGDQMAEAIARFYNGGKLSPLGLNFIGQRQPFGPLDDLKKLRDGILVGTKKIRFVRASAFIDPITDEEWEPIRIGDPRIRKFLIAWSRATGRPIPPTYAQLIGAQSVTEEEEDVEDGLDTPPENTNGAPAAGPVVEEEDEDWEDEEDEDWEDDEGDEGDWEDDGDGDEGDGGDARLGGTGGDLFVKASFQDAGNSNASGNANTNAASGGKPGLARPVFGRDRRRNPIIGVVSRSRARAVKTRYGLERHNQILFIYMPPPPRIITQNPNANTNASGGSGGIVDNNGNGIDDRQEQNLTNQNRPSAGGPP